MTDQPKADASTILSQTNRVGSAVQQTRRELAETTGTVNAIYDLIQPSGEGENPVLEALEQVLLALRHQSMTLDQMSTRLDRIEQRLRMRS